MSGSLNPIDVDDTVGVLVALAERDKYYSILTEQEKISISTLLANYRKEKVDRNELVLLVQQIVGRDKNNFFLSDEERSGLNQLKKRLIRNGKSARTYFLAGMQSRSLAYGLAGLVALGTVGFVGNQIVKSLNTNSEVSTITKHPLPVPAQIPLTQTDRQTIVSGLGPFSTIAPPVGRNPDTQAPAILLLREDGSTAASLQWTVPFTPTTWAKQDVLQLTAATRLGNYANLVTDQGRSYEVRLNQPFVLEENPNQVNLIDADGFAWQISSGRAIALRVTLKH